jgi:hypothetical protein
MNNNITSDDLHPKFAEAMTLSVYTYLNSLGVNDRFADILSSLVMSSEETYPEVTELVQYFTTTSILDAGPESDAVCIAGVVRAGIDITHKGDLLLPNTQYAMNDLQRTKDKCLEYEPRDDSNEL